MQSYPIEIVSYDPGWSEQYELERTRLQAALGDRVVRFEHMGSTSVPGLAAKPIIDVSAAVRSLSEVVELLPKLEELGYRLIPQKAIDRYDLWHCPTGPRPTHILHFMQVDSDAWIRPLIFRNALRADPELRLHYMELKSRLAESCGEDIDRYGSAKSEFICQVVNSFLEGR